jgi:hypothetical protein
MVSNKNRGRIDQLRGSRKYALLPPFLMATLAGQITKESQNMTVDRQKGSLQATWCQHAHCRGQYFLGLSLCEDEILRPKFFGPWTTPRTIHAATTMDAAGIDRHCVTE